MFLILNLFRSACDWPKLWQDLKLCHVSDLEERQRGELRERLVPDVQLPVGLPAFQDVVQVPPEVRL